MHYFYVMNTPIQTLATFFETEYPLNKHGLEALFALFESKAVKKGTSLLTVGKEEQHLRFLYQGQVREYYSTSEKETNINFYTRPQFISDLTSFTLDTPTIKQQEALSDIQYLVVGKADFRKLLAEYQCGNSFIELSFQKLLKQKELLEYNRVTKSPEDLYKELMMYKTHWLETIPQYHIASYLNITPETLSRIRKRIS